MHAIFKPHHFLDFLYEIAENNGVFEGESPFGHAMTYYGNLLSAGKIDTVTFTDGADSPCFPCRKLKDGICTDEFSAEVTARYGTNRKYVYNLGLDTALVKALPAVFSFDRERSIDEIYAALTEKLTPEIILLNWPRDNRVELTQRGLAMAIRMRSDAKAKQ
ncbi:MAG: hypothetical protein IKZ09_10845 [Clostridia bacterium]|nr:hypothetical protein [Clostridia bacterium]